MPSPAIPLSQALYLFPIGLERLTISLAKSHDNKTPAGAKASAGGK